MSSYHFFLFCFMILIIVLSTQEIHSGYLYKLLHSSHEDYNHPTSPLRIAAQSQHRKLLLYGRCSNRDISISQSKDSTSGIPQYIVQIVNTCVHGRAPSNLHLHCGWFASARMVNPTTFKRLSYDDCLVNGGKPLKSSEMIRFTYSNSFMYPLSFKSANF